MNHSSIPYAGVVAALLAALVTAGIVTSAAAQSGARRVPDGAPSDQRGRAPALDPAAKAGLHSIRNALPAETRPKLAAARHEVEGRLRTAGQGDPHFIAQGAIRQRLPRATPEQLELLTALLVGEWLEESTGSSHAPQSRVRRSGEDRGTDMEMMHLQERMSRRQRAIQLVTNILAKYQRTMQTIVSNIK